MSGIGVAFGAESIASRVRLDSRFVGVHRTHCCVKHGCKYGDDDCPVVSGHIVQDFPCEDCTEVQSSPTAAFFEELQALEKLVRRTEKYTDHVDASILIAGRKMISAYLKLLLDTGHLLPNMTLREVQQALHQGSGLLQNYKTLENFSCS